MTERWRAEECCLLWGVQAGCSDKVLFQQTRMREGTTEVLGEGASGRGRASAKALGWWEGVVCLSQRSWVRVSIQGEASEKCLGAQAMEAHEASMGHGWELWNFGGQRVGKVFHCALFSQCKVGPSDVGG